MILVVLTAITALSTLTSIVLIIEVSARRWKPAHLKWGKQNHETLILSMLLDANPSFSYDALWKFLSEGDSVYMSLFSGGSINHFLSYATDKVCRGLLQDINNGVEKYFGKEDMRTIKWSLVSIDTKNIVVRKDVSFKTVRVKLTDVNVGDNVTEYWKIRVTGKKFLVEEIL